MLHSLLTALGQLSDTWAAESGYRPAINGWPHIGTAFGRQIQEKAMSQKKKLTLGLSAAGVALVAGLGVSGAAYAATTTPTPTPSASASADAPTDGQRGGPGGHGKRGGGMGVQAAALATKLGVDEAKVKEALQAFRDANKPDAAGDKAAGTKPDRSAMEAALAASLAQSLGIDEAKVTAALEELRTEAQAERAAALKTRLDKAVTDGTLTQAEADGAAKAVEKGVIGGGR